MFKLRRSKNAVVAGLLVLSVLAAGSVAETSAKPTGDQLLDMLPAESLFCIRVNNFEYTLSQTDQFLAGVSPMPMGISMLVRMQFANLLGNPQLTGVNMNGSFAIFGAILSGEPTQTNPVSNMFVGVLVPITDYKQFISSNPNCGEPDEKGVSKITSNGTPILLATQAGNYALMSWANDYDKLVAMAKVISATRTTGLAGTLDAAEAKLAVTEPIWAYGNVQQASKAFGPLVFGKIEQIKAEIKNIEPNSPETPPMNIQNIINMYVGILETLMKETQSLSIAINPKPNVLNITKTISAVPGTDMAKMFAADTSTEQENKLLGYLEDGAMMNLGIRMNTPFWKKLNVKGIDLLSTIAGESMSTEDIAKMKTLAINVIDCLGGPVACSISIDTKNKPPFAIKYVIAVRDAGKFNQLTEEAMQMMNTSGIMDFYKQLGMETSFTIKRNVDSYKDVAIDSAKLTMKSTDANSPQGQMINAMYGGGFDYRWAMVDGLCVMSVGGDVNSTIRQLIDQVKAGGPKQIGAEIKAALALLPEAKKADFLATYNLLRAFKMLPAILPLPMPQMDIPTKSNIVAAGKVGDGRIVVDIAVPKEHLTEIMAVFLTMQQQMQEKPKVQPNPEQ